MRPDVGQGGATPKRLADWRPHLGEGITAEALRLGSALGESPPLSQRYEQLATPTFIVWDTEDTVIDPSRAKGFQALFPHSEVRLMAGCGHVAMLEAPRDAARDYLRFRATLAA